MPEARTEEVQLGRKNVRVGSIAGFIPIYKEEPCGPVYAGRITIFPFTISGPAFSGKTDIQFAWGWLRGVMILQLGSGTHRCVVDHVEIT